MTYNFPFLRTILQSTDRFLIDALTFIIIKLLVIDLLARANLKTTYLYL
jgi:hypothetical protein